MRTARISPAQVQFLKEIENPQTGEQLLLALQNPHSPESIQLNNLLLEDDKRRYARYIEEIIEQIKSNKLTEQEKIALFLYHIACGISEKRRLAGDDPPPAIAVVTDEPPNDKDSLMERILARAAEMRQIEQDIQNLKEIVTELHLRASHNTTTWQTLNKTQQEQFLSTLKNKTIHLQTDQGMPLTDEQVLQKVTEALASPPPMAVIQRMGDAWKVYHHYTATPEPPTTAGEATPPAPPPPPPLPPDFPSDKVLAQKSNINAVIRLLGACCDDEGSPKDILNALKNNQAGLDALQEALDAPEAGQQITRESCFTEAVNIYSELSRCKLELSVNTQTLANCHSAQTRDEQSLEQLEHQKAPGL